MKVHSILLVTSLVISNGCLTAGYIIAGFWPIIPVLLAIFLFWLYVRRRSAFWSASILLLASVLLAAIGITIGLSLILVPTGTPLQSSDRLPPGWRRTGQPQFASQYVIQLDRQTKRSGASSVRIRSKPFARGSAVVRQAIDAKPYRGTRLRLRGYARVSHVSQWAGLWMRI